MSNVRTAPLYVCLPLALRNDEQCAYSVCLPLALRNDEQCAYSTALSYRTCSSPRFAPAADTWQRPAMCDQQQSRFSTCSSPH